MNDSPATALDSSRLEDVVRGISLGLAVTDARDWSVSFDNAKFFQ
jgi:hypothetical protein